MDLRDGFGLLRRLGMVETSKRFVEQNDFRVDRKAARKLQPLQLTQRQRARQLALGAGQSDRRKDLCGALALTSPIDTQQCAQRTGSVINARGQNHIVEHRHLGETAVRSDG